VRKGGPLSKASLTRWGLVIASLGFSSLALWLFLFPFHIPPVFVVGSVVAPTETPADDLTSFCNAPIEQVFSSPLDSTGTPFVVTMNPQPMCLTVARTRALASLGFAVAALLAFGLASATARPRTAKTNLLG
jgi:hypothetical protein